MNDMYFDRVLPVPSLRTARLDMEPLSREHAREMFPLLADPGLYEFTGGEGPASEEKLISSYTFLEGRRSPDGREIWLNWALRLRETGALTGYAQSTVTRERAYVAWVVGSHWQGRGLATDAAVAIVNWLEEKGAPEIRACVHPQHRASQRVAANAGLSRTDDLEDGEEVWVRRHGGFAAKASAPAERAPVPAPLPSLVVCDIVGTLLEDLGWVEATFRTVFRARGIELFADDVRSVRGAAKNEAIRTLLSKRGDDVSDLDRETDELAKQFREELPRAVGRLGVGAIEGADGALQSWRSRGMIVALNTGLERGTTAHLLERVGWASTTFDHLVCAEDVDRGRPAPDMIHRAMRLAGVDDPARVANIGDTIQDVRAGRNAKVKWNVAVLTGAHARDHLQVEGPTHVIASIAHFMREVFAKDQHAGHRPT